MLTLSLDTSRAPCVFGPAPQPHRSRVRVVVRSQMPEIKSIAVFCGSSKGKGDSYMDSATLLGEEMVRRNIKLVYGGDQAILQWLA